MASRPAEPGKMQVDTVVGDAAFGALIDQHGATVRASIRAVLGHHPDEEDLVQEVFTRLLIRLRQPGPIDVGAWCWRSARNLAIDQVRRRSATPTEDAAFDLPCGEGLDREVLGREMGTQLAASLRRLPAHHRRVLLAQIGSDDRPERRSQAAIAAELGLSAKATESLLARARVRLRAELRHLGVESGGGALAVGLALAARLGFRRRPGAGPAGLAAKAKAAVAGAALVASGAGAAAVPLVAHPANRPAVNSAQPAPGRPPVGHDGSRPASGGPAPGRGWQPAPGAGRPWTEAAAAPAGATVAQAGDTAAGTTQRETALTAAKQISRPAPTGTTTPGPSQLPPGTPAAPRVTPPVGRPPLLNPLYNRISSTEVVNPSSTSGTGLTPNPGPSGTLRWPASSTNGSVTSLSK